MNSNFILIFIWLLFSLVFMLLVFLYMLNRNAKHNLNYPHQWKNYKEAIENRDIDAILNYGKSVVMNDHFEIDHRKEMFEDIQAIKKEHPELEPLWIDVHYKYKGVDPVEE